MQQAKKDETLEKIRECIGKSLESLIEVSTLKSMQEKRTLWLLVKEANALGIKSIHDVETHLNTYGRKWVVLYRTVNFSK